MIDMFDRLGDTLNGLIGSHQNNNVKYAHEQVFAGGGFAGLTCGVSNAVNSDSSLGSLLRNPSGCSSALKIAGAPQTNIFGGAEKNYYSSPFAIGAHIQGSFGNFFRGVNADPGSTNKSVGKPQEGKPPPQSETPNDFYARWYNRMRQFAEAEEVAGRGQVQTRSR